MEVPTGRPLHWASLEKSGKSWVVHLPAQSVSKMRSAWVPWFRIVLRPQSPFTSFKGRAEVTSWRRFPPTQLQSGCHRCCSFFLCVCVCVCVCVWVCVCSLHSWPPLVLLGCCSGILPGQGRSRVLEVGLSSPEPRLFSHHVPAEGRYRPRWILPVLQGG